MTTEPAGSNDLRTAAKGGGIAFAGKLFEYVVRFAFGILIARVVGVEQYGLYTLGITVALIASNMAMLGLQTGMVRFLPPAIRAKDNDSVWGILQVCIGLPALFSLSLAVLLFLLAQPLAALMFQDARMVVVLRMVSIIVPLDTLASMAYVITISFKQPKYSVIANNIIAPVIKLLLAGAFLALGFAIQGVLAAQILATAAGLAIMVYYVNALFSLRRVPVSPMRFSGQLLRYSLPVHLGWMVNTLRSSFSTLVLGFLGLTSGVGIYTAASRFSMIGSMFYLSIGNISTPIIAEMHHLGQHAQMSSYYQTTTRWMILLNLPVFLTSLLFARPLLSIFGDDFTSGAASMMILAAGTLVYTSTGIGANILDMTDHPKVNTANAIIMVFVTIGLNVLLTSRLGVVGAAIASSSSIILVNLLSLFEVWYFVRIQPYNRTLWKPLLAALVAALAAYGFNQVVHLPSIAQLVLGSGVLWGAYGLMLILLKLPAEDHQLVERLLARIRPARATKQDRAAAQERPASSG